MLLKIAQGSGYFFISALVRIVNMEIIVSDSHFPHEIYVKVYEKKMK